MRSLIFTILISLLSLNLFSQNYSKLDVGLKSKLSNNIKRNSTNYDVFVEGNTDEIKSIITENGGDINTVTSSLLTAIIPYKTLEALSNSEDVKHIQLAKVMHINNSEMLKNIDAIKVHQGEEPLNKKYKGKGVIVGIIDTGIKWDHEDFIQIDDPNKSRILNIWDQKLSGGKQPEGFSYGKEYTREDINTALKGSSFLETSDSRGHGTHVAGIAAGNLGVAPEADIIVVRVDFSKSTGAIDAANYIYGIADKLNRPCVINTSFGYHNTLHNGSDPSEIMIDEMLKDKPGRSFVNSAGNNGIKYYHLNIDAKPDVEQWSWFIPEGYNFHTSELYAAVKNEDLDKMSIAFGLDSTTFEGENRILPSEFIKKTEYITLKEIADSDNAKRLTILYRDNSNAANIDIIIAKKNEEYSEVTIVINEDIKDQQTNKGIGWIRLYAKGSGEMHIWNQRGRTAYNPQAANLTVDDNYINPDNSSIISTPGNAKRIITAGAYINRTSWTNSLGNIIDYSDKYKAGDFALFSSQGPTLDGRIKPEISAPGMFVMSALSGMGSELGISEDQKHIIQSGTSMACPVVVGAIALLLEKNPTLTNKEIRDILFANTDKDEFTGELTTPDNKWGYGKLNIFKAITNTAIASTKIITSAKHQLIHNIYPNPCNEYIQLKVNSTTSCDIEIYNSMGSLVYKNKTNQQQKDIKVNTNSWNPGLYLIKSYSGNTFEQIKFVKN
ncbi:MAG: S8/S53 family peptidase [Hyphomicrobiales bacterium]